MDTFGRDMRHLPIVIPALIAAVTAQGAARESTYQGRTLAEWLAADPHDAMRVPDDLGFLMPRDQALAIMALGPGSRLEDQAMAWMKDRVTSMPEGLGAFGEKALPILLEHRRSIEPSTFCRAVVRVGPSGARLALAELRQPHQRQQWLEAFRVASPATTRALVVELAQAQDPAIADVLDCLNHVSAIPVDLLEAVTPLLAREELANSIESLLARLPPDGVPGLFEKLGKEGNRSARWRMWYAVRRWSGEWAAIPAALLPLLQQCLADGDDARVIAAAWVLARWDRPAPELAPLLLRAARERRYDVYTRAAAFAALWRVGGAVEETRAALAEVLADRSERNSFLIEQCVGGLEPLGESAVPFLRQALVSDRSQLRGVVIEVARRLGAQAAALVPDIEGLLAAPDHLYQVVTAVRAIAPERWPALEKRLLELARSDAVPATVKTMAGRLLVQWSAPRGEVLAFFVELHRSGSTEVRDLDRQLKEKLCSGGALAPLVEALAQGKLELLQQHTHLLPALCQAGVDLKPAVPWLRTQFADLERRQRKSIESAARSWCGTMPVYPHGAYARLLGAAGDLPFLRRLLGNDLLKHFGYLGLGEMARRDLSAARLLVDRLLKLEQGPANVAEVQDIVQALAGGGAETARILASSMFGAAPEQTRAILGALGRMGAAASEAVPEVESLLRETKDSEVAAAAQVALRFLVREAPAKTDDLAAVLALLAETRGEIDAGLLDRVVPQLAEHAGTILAASRHLPPASRATLIRAAGGVFAPLPGPAATSTAAQQLHGILTLERVFRAAGRPGLTGAQRDELFLPCLLDPDARVRSAALHALTTGQTSLAPEHRPKLAESLMALALDDPDWRLRHLAWSSLGGLTAEQSAALRRGPEDPDRFVGAQAREVLQRAAAMRRQQQGR